MCGICGIYSKGSEEVERETIMKMRDVMINRGPDDAGLHIAPHVGLGHRRLSIIDISVDGRQPLTNEDKTIWMVFNGEIYNYSELHDILVRKGHIFSSKTDSEVLIHGYEEWGLENLLRKINGMFAFAIWNAMKEELILVRDRLGIKPLFFMERDGKVFFSSDIKSIWLVYTKELTVNYEAIDHFLHSYCIPQEYSIFKEIKKVLPAHYIRFDKNKTLVRKYWHLSFTKKKIMNEDEYIEELKDRLMLATKRRMISDVPLGAFLSGGVDSSLIVAMMANSSSGPVKTFSIGFKEETHNELKYARMVAEKYSTEHHEFIVEPDAIGILPSIIWSYGEPFADSSQIPTYYVAKMTKEYVKVVLTGDGGDESFSGYENILNHYYGDIYRKYLPSFVGSRLLPLISDILISVAGRRGIIRKMKSLTVHGGKSFVDNFRVGNVFGIEYRDKLYSPEFKQRLSGHDPTDIFGKHYAFADGIDEVDKALYVDIKTSLPNDYLTKVDIATMMNSLEARSPFLDYELMEYAAMIPSKTKMKYGRKKYLLKKLASDFVPYEAVYRKKWGFGMPIGYWFKDKFALLLKNILLSDSAVKRGYFSGKYVKNLLDDHIKGRSDHSHRLWTLLCLELWHLMFIDKVITVENKLNLNRNIFS